MIVFCAVAFALEVPRLQGRVNDYAEMLSPGMRQELEARLAEFEKTDSTQVVVLTVQSLEGDAIEDFSIKVAEAWKIGQAGKDNGVILTVAKADRRMRIEVGRGLEGVLTDLHTGRIIDYEMKPRFKAGDFDAGFSEAVNAIIAASRGEYKPEESPSGQTSGGPSIDFGNLLFFGAIAVMVLGKISKYLGIGAGAVGLPLGVNYAFGASPLGLNIALVVFGALGGLFLSAMKGGGGGYSSGGYSSGGGSSWGSSSSGGFSGGGGSFGGGGSSGSW